MKVGIVDAGAVGTACTFAMALRGSARDIVLGNRNPERARGVVADLQYGAVLAPTVRLRDGAYVDLRGAAIVMITVGVNEKAGGATGRGDPAGRLRLLNTNARVYRDISQAHREAQEAADGIDDPSTGQYRCAGECARAFYTGRPESDGCVVQNVDRPSWTNSP
jgi:malate/lactate dehydrogenase